MSIFSRKQPPDVSSMKNRLQNKKAQALDDFDGIKERKELEGTLVKSLGSDHKRNKNNETNIFIGKVEEAKIVNTNFYGDVLYNKKFRNTDEKPHKSNEFTDLTDLIDSLTEFKHWKKNKSDDEKDNISDINSIYPDRLSVHNATETVRSL